MAHSERIKAQALVELMTGESPRHVAQMLGIPLTTVKRWRNVDMKQWMREIFPHGVALGRIKMAPKKR